MGSSIILIAMVALWAMVLIPLMLKKNSQQFENKSVDRFKNAMSLISRTAPATVELVYKLKQLESEENE